jgi:hypothetical protein
MPTIRSTSLLFGFIISAILPVSAQYLVIELDAEKGTTTYYRDGVEVKHPRMRKGETVQVKVRNFNNYLYAPVITERGEDEAPGSGSMPLLNAPGFNFGDTFKGNSPGLVQGTSGAVRPFGSISTPVAPRESVRIESAFLRDPDRSPASDKTARLKLAAWNQLQALADLEQALSQNHASLAELKQREKLRVFSVEEAQKMRLNPHLPPSRIKEDATSVLAKALNLAPGVLPTLDEVFLRNDDRGFLANIKLKETDLMKRYALGLTHLQSLDAELENLGGEDMSIPVFEAAFKAQFNASEQVITDSDALLTVVDSLAEVAAESDLQSIMQIWYAYEAIASNDFSTVYQTTLRHDFTTIEVQFNRKNEAAATEAHESVRLAPVLLRSVGGIKVNTSVGIAMGAFQKRQYAHFVANQVIGEQEEDRFAPYLTSYLHFYSQGRGSISVGGSFGAGLQLGSELGLSAAHLFIGPSLFFGNSERFVLNAGLMFGKAKRLDKGLKVGDTFEGTDSELPLRNQYQLGFALGLSFNLK